MLDPFKKQAVLIICFLLLIGCIDKPIRGIEYFSEPNFSASSGMETWGIILAMDHFQDGFERTFEKVYGDVSTFEKKIEEQLAKSFILSSVNIKTIEIDEKTFEKVKIAVKKPGEELPSMEEEYQNLFAKISKENQVDRVIVLRHWTILDSHSFTPGMMIGPGQMTPGTSKTYCHVKLTGTVIDSSGKPLYMGQGLAEEMISFFAYKNGLESTVSKCISNFVELITGRMPKEEISTS